MPKIQWTLPDENDLDVENEWENLKNGGDPQESPSAKGAPPFENTVIEEVPIEKTDKDVAKFLSTLPEEAQKLLKAVYDKGEIGKVFDFSRRLLNVAKLLDEKDYRETVQKELRAVLKISAVDSDGFRGYVRSVIALVEDRLADALPYGVREVPGPDLPPPSGDNLQYITSTMDVEKRLEAYWENSSHSVVSIDSGDYTSRAKAFDIFDSVRGSFLRETVGESMLRLAVKHRVGDAKSYEHMITGIDEMRAEYLDGLKVIYENWESPGIENELCALIEAASKIHPIEYKETRAQVDSPWVYLGTYRIPEAITDIDFNLQSETFRLAGSPMTPLQVASLHLRSEGTQEGNCAFVALALAHSAGLLDEAPTTWLRRAEATGGCPICLDVLVRKRELPLVCTACGRGK